MSYKAIDPTIEAWAVENALKMNTAFAGREARFCYTSSEQECFQVSIDPPTDALVCVHAWSVDTADDAELHREWTVPFREVRPTLDAALAAIKQWMKRPR